MALGLTDAEQSFYDALADNPSAQELMKEEVLFLHIASSGPCLMVPLVAISV